jgi:hypothetical protein
MPDRDAQIEEIQAAINRILLLLKDCGQEPFQMGAQEILDDLLSRKRWTRKS